MEKNVLNECECGSIPQIYKDIDKPYWYVMCEACGVSTDASEISLGHAVQIWNDKHGGETDGN